MNEQSFGTLQPIDARPHVGTSEAGPANGPPVILSARLALLYLQLRRCRALC